MPQRENAIVNRLNKTKVERVVDHEQERVDRTKAEAAARRVAAAQKVRIPSRFFSSSFSEGSASIHANLGFFWLGFAFGQKKEDAELARKREAEKAARSYDSLFNGEDDGDEGEEATGPRKTGRELEEDFM